MKKLLLSLAVCSTLFASCHKDDDDMDVPNNFIINGDVHQIRNSGRVGGNFTIFINDGNALTEQYNATFVFAGNPTTGVYRIVDFPVAPDEVSILLQNGNPADLYRSSTNAGSVRVAVDGAGKATISLFDPALLQPLLPTGDGGVELTANFREL